MKILSKKFLLIKVISILCIFSNCFVGSSSCTKPIIEPIVKDYRLKWTGVYNCKVRNYINHIDTITIEVTLNNELDSTINIKSIDNNIKINEEGCFRYYNSYDEKYISGLLCANKLFIEIARRSPGAGFMSTIYKGIKNE